MEIPGGYRLRRPRLFTNLAAALLVAGAPCLAVGIAADAIETPLRVTEIIVSGLVPVILIAIAVWPVRVLDLTSRSLRFRARLAFVQGRGRQPTRSALREVAWSDVVEVLLAPHRGRVTMIVGFRAPGPVLHAAVVDLPVRDEEAVASAISTIVPGAVVRRGRLPELLIHTRLPYATGQARIGIQVLCLVLSGLAMGTTIVLFNLLPGPASYGAGPLAGLFLIFSRTWFASPALFVSPEGISLSKGWRTRTVPWTAVASVSLTAEGDGGELAVRVGQASGRLAAGTVLTCRVPRWSGLADLDAIIRAYAPPHALHQRLPAG